jgi:nicotinamidase-related amidase
MDLDPTTTAVLTMELQRGVCGDLSPLAALRDAVTESGAALAAGALCTAARQSGAWVVHCTFSLRPDRIGSRFDLNLMAGARRDPDYLLEGSDACAVLPELGPDHSDLFCDRHHGISPFTGTSLDQMLRSLGIATIVATGVSLNVGIPGMCTEAVNLGYSVIVATDAVVGLPRAYGDEVLRNSLIAYTRLASTADISAALLAPAG